MKRSRVMLLIAFIVISLVNFSAVFTDFGPTPAAADMLCKVQPCQIGGKNCLCCLQIPGAISCPFQCGAVDCGPPY